VDTIMSKTKLALSTQNNPIAVMDAIYKRRSVRDYTPEIVTAVTIETLLYAAIQAPTAMHEEPWAFAVIQDKALLDRISVDAKKIALDAAVKADGHTVPHSVEILSNPNFNIFYNASTLVVIYGSPMGSFATADCWLAAENMMLAAYASGLGSCVIGFALAALNMPEWRKALDIPAQMIAHAPILLGHPAGETPVISRKPPEVLCWKKAAAA
jgi:nitroreductase